MDRLRTECEGIATTWKGAGNHIREFPPLRRQGIQRLSREQWGAGRSIWSADIGDRTLVVDRIAVKESTKAPTHIAIVLELEEDDAACARSRRFVLEGKPVLTAISYPPAGLVAGSPITPGHPGGGVVREVYEETGIKVRVDRLTGVYKNVALGVVAMVFRCTPESGHQRPPDESTAVAWLTPDEVVERMDEAFAIRVTDAPNAGFPQVNVSGQCRGSLPGRRGAVEGRSGVTSDGRR